MFTALYILEPWMVRSATLEPLYLDIMNYIPHLEGFDFRLASHHKETTTAQNVGTNFLKTGVHMCVKLIYMNIQDCGTMLIN
jgi:hypothetical protein